MLERLMTVLCTLFNNQVTHEQQWNIKVSIACEIPKLSLIVVSFPEIAILSRDGATVFQRW
jgi:hypothetical protein